MIPRSADWKNILSNAVRDPAELLALLELPRELLPAARDAARQFPLRVPRAFVARMAKGDPHDPLLRQVLPLGEELCPSPGFGLDPVGDHSAASAPGVLRKYQGRALLVATGACAIHCRYCFRRHYPYHEENPARNHWRTTLISLAASPETEEVIISGGDPLLLDDARLAELIQGLAAIPHIKRLRIHSRLPVTVPERITPDLLNLLTGTRLDPVMVVHANHPRELGGEVNRALRDLRNSYIPTFNQTVLLRGVNDHADILVSLSEDLFQSGVQPYYLHLLDRVSGAAHFEVDEARAHAVVEQLRRRLPGYLMPRPVREVEGAPYKRPVFC